LRQRTKVFWFFFQERTASFLFATIARVKALFTSPWQHCVPISPHSEGQRVKGVVFREFFNYIEVQHGDEMLDDVIVASDLPHGGAYTSVGTYPFEEMLSLVHSYTAASARSEGCVFAGFGEHCFLNWLSFLPEFFSPARHLFDILEQVNDFHEREVRKLYPDAELPTFTTESRGEHDMVVGYHSEKQLRDFAVGVIHGAAIHLRVAIEVSTEDAEDAAGPYTRIRIRMAAPAACPERAALCPVMPPI
jgi:hypothetical protein